MRILNWFFNFLIFFTLNKAYLNAYEIDLSPYEKQYFSQNGEDGVIEKIFKLIGTTNQYYVDFGASEGHVCSNTKYLRDQYNWIGLLMDGRHEDLSINLHKEFITAENVISLFEKYNVPKEFDLLSLDIDYNDFYVWRALTQNYRPRVVVIEYNCVFGPDQDKVVVYDPQGTWDCTDYYGGSMLAFYNLGRHLGYTLVYQESNAINLIFVRDDVLEISNVHFKDQNNVNKLFNCPAWRIERNGGILNNPYMINSRKFGSSGY